MRRIYAIIRTNRRIISLSTFAVLASASPSFAQPIGDPRELRPSDVELSKRLEPLIPSFRAALQGDNIDSQRATLAIIADIPPALAAGTNLSASLAQFLQKDHKDAEILALGIRSLGRSFPDAADLGRVLPKYVRSKHTIVRQAVAEAIGTAILNSAPSGRSVANAGYFIDVSKQTIPLLGTGMEDENGETQRLALTAIQSISRTVNDLYSLDSGPIGEEPIPKTVEARFAPLAPVVQALAAEVSKLAVPLAASDARTRAAAARTLEALAVLRAKILERQGPGVAKDNFESSWPVLRPVLVKRIKDENASVRLATAEAIESLGEAFEARVLMREATGDSSAYVRWSAARALGKLASSTPDLKSAAPDVAALTRLVNDKDIDVRTAALVALSKFGPKAKAASATILVAANRGDIEPRVIAVKALGAIESDASATVPILIEGLKHNDDRLKRTAASGLVRFGPDAKDALPELRKALQSEDAELRLAAAEAILAIEKKPRLKDL